MKEYPETIEYDIDRKRLARYWRLQSVIMLAILGVFVFLFAALALMDVSMENHTGLSPAEFTELVAHRIAMGALYTLAFLTTVYFLFAHFQARFRATSTRLLVEGSYLRFISGWLIRRDRRIHFRAISDYSTIDSPLLKASGLRALSFTVAGLIGQHGLTTIPGIIDAQKVRDELCAIDAMREGY